MQKIIHQLSWFVGVGCAAALTHWIVVVFAVGTLGYVPLVANILGWLVAFCVSFAGHFRLTFRHQQASLWYAARRFFVVSALGFGVNELSYAFLLHTTPLRYDVLLALILIAVAAMTFILSRFWAFQHKN